MESIFGKVQNASTKLSPIINEFYERPADAVTALVTVDGEYNDNTYDNKIEYVGIYDGQGREIHPLPGKERDARKRLKSAVENAELVDHESREPVEEVVIRIQTPELYVKE